MEVRLVYFDGCPHWKVADERLRALEAEVGFRLTYEKVETVEAARERGFRGSPTVLVDGRDPFGPDEAAASGLSCRLYQTPDGLAGAPTTAQLREVLQDSPPRPG